MKKGKKKKNVFLVQRNKINYLKIIKITVDLFYSDTGIENV